MAGAAEADASAAQAAAGEAAEGAVPPPPAPSVLWRPEDLAVEAERLPIAKNDPELLSRALDVLRTWHARFPAQVWGRIVKFAHEGGTRHMPKVLKELNEVAPIIRKVEAWLLSLPADAPAASIVDLCSGFGFLGMFLADLVPDAGRVAEIVLVDRGWPNPHIGSKGSISNDHIYSHGPWRVPIQTIKSDIKEQRNIKSLLSRVVACEDRPCFVCAVHLCGTLSLRAAQLFNASARVQALALVPCCMPPKSHAVKEAVYQLGGHSFTARSLRDQAQNQSASARFRAWVENVSEGVDPGPGGEKSLEVIRVGAAAQHGGKGEAYAQDFHLFAHRAPWGSLGALPPLDAEVEGAGLPVVVEARWLLPAAEAKEAAACPADEPHAESTSG